MTLGKTPWVDRNITSILPQLRQHVPESWLPRTMTESGRNKPVVEEYGCGHYGCVMPTNEPDLVMKLTSDPSEAWFIARALTLEPTSGIVEYKKIFALDATHKSRSLFVLWRTEAHDIGSWQYSLGRKNDPYARQVTREAGNYLEVYLFCSRYVREYVHPRLRDIQLVEAREEFLSVLWQSYERSEPVQESETWHPDGRGIEGYFKNLRGLQRVGVALRTALYASQKMQGNPSLYHVGEALGHYLENGIMLADVHSNNIGLDTEDEAIITDPGHAVEFNPRWAEPPQVPML